MCNLLTNENFPIGPARSRRWTLNCSNSIELEEETAVCLAADFAHVRFQNHDSANAFE